MLAAKLFDAEWDELEYRANMSQEGNNISVGFQPIPPQLIDTNSCQVESGPIQSNSPKIEKKKQNLALNQTLILLSLILKMN